MQRFEKVYVSVDIHVDTEGMETLECLIWSDGARYAVDKTVDKRLSPPKHVGAMLTERYDVIIEGRPRTVYREKQTNKWFVERAVN